MMAESEKIDLAILDRKIQDIFPLPAVLEKILQVINEPGSSLAAVENIFKYEPCMTLKILGLANSAYYGSSGKITNIHTAITLLGLNLVKNLAIHASVNDLFRFGTTLPGFSGYELWKHSVGVAVATKMISRQLKLGNAEDFFTLGILHDVGLIIEYQFCQRGFISVLTRISEGGVLTQIEQEILGTHHAALAKRLFEKWQMPEALTQTIFYHHTPLAAPAPLQRHAGILYLADNLVRRKNFGFGSPPDELSAEILALLNWEESRLAQLQQDFDQEIMEMTLFLQ